MDEQIYPYHMDAEKAVLGGILMNDSTIHYVLPFLLPHDFYIETHQKIYDAMVDMAAANIPIDLLSLREKLVQRKTTDDSVIGDLALLNPLEYDYKHVEHWARIVKKYSRYRGIVQLSREVIEKVEQLDEIDEIVNFYDVEFSRLAIMANASLLDSGKLTQQFADKLEQKKVQTYGFPSGLQSVDRYTGGFQRKELSIIAGLPSRGKTAFATTLCTRLEKTTKTAIFSLEQSADQWLMRMVCADQKLNLFAIRNGRLNQSELANVHRTLNRYGTLPIQICEDFVSVNQIASMCKHLKFSKGLDLVIIDYLSLIHHQMPKGQRYEEHQKYSAIIAKLKALAKEIDVAVILLSQLNRECADYHEPSLRHLAETAKVERDADVIIFLWQKEAASKEFHDMITIAKSRSGQTGHFRILFTKEFVRFDDYSNRQE